MSWHLPEDFDDRTDAERAEILSWVTRVIVTCATEYRTYQARMRLHAFSLRFATSDTAPGDTPARAGPADLSAEVAELTAYKSAELAERPYLRTTRWTPATAAMKLEQLGLLFGALSSAPDGPVEGLGWPMERLCLAMLTFPVVWDAYLGWRRRRRGFFTSWESDLLKFASGMTDEKAGWFVQRPDLARRLAPIAGVITEPEILAAQADWPAHCASLHRFARQRLGEVERLARVHNDPFEPILPVLEAARPAATYRKIADEVFRRRPDRHHFPRAAAESARAYLMIRLGLHLGFRSRNLRELLVSHRHDGHRPELRLAKLRRGELRWNQAARAWEVFAPAVAFKNADSRFFSGGPFRLKLSNLGGLYDAIDDYLEVHRAELLRRAPDPGTFFVKSMTSDVGDASFSGTGFYQTWRTILERYGIYNPWTGKGAIAGLLPHGPHSVRTVIATHVLKVTGSYEQASYAIQDAPETLIQHYARFLPEQRAGLAAAVLDQAWAESDQA